MKCFVDLHCEVKGNVGALKRHTHTHTHHSRAFQKSRKNTKQQMLKHSVRFSTKISVVLRTCAVSDITRGLCFSDNAV